MLGHAMRYGLVTNGRRLFRKEPTPYDHGLSQRSQGLQLLRQGRKVPALLLS